MVGGAMEQIDMSIFTEQNFKALDLLKKQPFQKEIYDWKIVEEKDRVSFAN